MGGQNLIMINKNTNFDTSDEDKATGKVEDNDDFM